MNESQDTNNRLAIRRTSLAKQRNILAAERTFSAWIRTGLGAVAAGLAVAKLIHRGSTLTALLGGTLIVTGTLIYIIAFHNYYHVFRFFHREGHGARSFYLLITLIVVLCLCSAGAFALLMF